MSIKKFLSQLSVWTIIVPLIIIFTLIYPRINDELLKLYTDFAIDFMEKQNINITYYVNNMQSSLVMISELEVVKEILDEEDITDNSIDKLNEFFNGREKTIDYSNEIYLIDENMKIVSSNVKASIGNKVIDEDPIRNIFEEENVFADISYDINDERCIVMYAPVKQDKEVIGVLAEKISIQGMNTFLNETKNKRLEDVIIVDNDKQIISSKYKNEYTINRYLKDAYDFKFSNEDSNQFSYYINNKEYYASYQEIENSNWKALYMFKDQSIGYEFENILNQSIIIILFSGLIIYMIIRVIFKSLMKEINYIDNAMKRLNTGYVNIIKDFRWDEIKVLSDSFNKMSNENENNKIKILKKNAQIDLLLEKNNYCVFEIDIENNIIEERGYVGVYSEKTRIRKYNTSRDLFDISDISDYYINKFDEVIEILKQGNIESMKIDIPVESKLDQKKNWYEFSMQYITVDNKGKIIGIISSIDDRKKEEEKLKLLSRIDNLTGLLNKSSFENEVKKKIENEYIKNSYIAMLDLDDFKYINDKYGHINADKILVYISHVLRTNIDDVNIGISSRFGGDEFVIYIENIDNKEEIYKILNNIKSTLNLGYKIGDENIPIKVSIGATLIEDNEYEITLKKADFIMYKSKVRGKNIIQID